MKILKFLFSISLALVFATLGASVISPLIGVNPHIIGPLLFAANFIPGTQGVLPMLIYTCPVGPGAFTQNFAFLPQFLNWNDGGNPLTNLRISSREDGGVLHDWDAAALAAMNGYMCVGAQAANELKVQLASGHLVRNMTISGTTSAAGAINFYANSDNQVAANAAVVPFKSQMDTAIALTPTVFQNFNALFIPTMATLTDYADIQYIDGHIERNEKEDLLRNSSYFQQVQGVIINNMHHNIHRVTLRCAANTPVYTLRYFIKGQ